MASLGELTAGIAHEIQNPLNFVNNFSELSCELIAEMEEEMGNDNKDDVILIAESLKKNLEKINQHGKRAAAIVKNMLEHSRSTKAVKELSDINLITDEYLRLAYHGFRAKKKNFTARIDTEFDSAVPNIKIVAQDIGRVLLNLIGNALYAVPEKKISIPPTSAPNYEPVVSVRTKKTGPQVCITVSDNGNGIPEQNIGKIFQPFFTTKPTGTGSGLGLSLSYDIIKAHNGEIKVETQEGGGSTFMIQLPLG